MQFNKQKIRGNLKHTYSLYMHHIFWLIFNVLKILGFFLINIMIITRKCSKSDT